MEEDMQVMTRLFNAFWSHYEMWKVYDNWVKFAPTLDKDFIITDKCANVLPDALKIPFRDLYKRIRDNQQPVQ